MDEAMQLSSIRSPALGGAAAAAMMDRDDDEEEEMDEDLEDLRNGEVDELPDAPIIGSRSRNSDIFGDEAENFGRASSPKLYAQAGRFPNAVQFRVWRWENGVPVAIGAIDAEANEEDFVRSFFDAMPKPGDGRFQFRFRPIDIRGQELGKEFTLNISEHHATLRQMRAREKAERDDDRGYGGGGRGDVIVNGGGNGADTAMAEEMGRMFESAVENAERRTELLQSTLEMERERLRMEEGKRAEERVSMAERSADVVQKMTEKLMSSDRLRAEEAMKAQRDQGQLLLGTLTTVFQQQQQAAREQGDRLREADSARMVQDREFFDRQRQEMELRRQHERDEEERRRQRDREEWERKREEERARLDLEMKRIEEQRKYERELLVEEARRRDLEVERRRETERNELQIRVERERMEMDRQRDAMREERERWRQEMEDKRRSEQMEWERKSAAERDDRERRERTDRDRWEREKLELQQRTERERMEWDRKEALRREELTREEGRRREEMQIQQQQLTLAAQRDREHAERMMEMARLEREAQREAQANREKAERDARDAADRDRQRQHELQMKEMELSKERDREHAERMLQLSKSQGNGGIGGIIETLGLDAATALRGVLGLNKGEDEESEEGSGWSQHIPLILSGLAAFGTTMAAARKGGAEGGPAQVAGPQNQVLIQTPNGPQMIPADALAQMRARQMAQQAQQAQQGPQMPVLGRTRRPVPELPSEPMIPQGVGPAVAPPDEAPVPTMLVAPPIEPEAEEEAAEVDVVVSDAYRAGLDVDTMKRAKAAKMTLPKQKVARKAIRELGEKLGKAEEGEWMALVTEALMKEMSIFTYLEAVSIYAALAEAKIEPALAERIVKALRESGMIPETLPFDEADYARLHSITPETPVEAQ
jgi:hypothetical protein